MLQTINHLLRNAITTADTDPAKIPARLSLEGIGTIPYAVYQTDLFGGERHKIIPTDKTRTWHYVRSPNNLPLRHPVQTVDVNTPPAARATPLGYMLFGSFAGICVGLGVALGGIAVLNPWLVLAGAITMAVSMVSLAAGVHTPPKRPRHLAAA